MLELRRRWIAQELLLPNTLDGAAKGAKVYWDSHASGVGFYTNLTSRIARKMVQVKLRNYSMGKLKLLVIKMIFGLFILRLDVVIHILVHILLAVSIPGYFTCSANHFPSDLFLYF